MLAVVKCVGRDLLKTRRNLLNRKSFYCTQKTFEEIKIPVPWGHVTGKWWGPQDRRPVLALHGWMDSCGTFDTLIPYLPSHLGVLAIDFPGHGLSSKLPPGIFYHGIDRVVLVRRIANYFKWKKISLLGHSLGAMGNFIYALLYPKTIDFVICLDGLVPLYIEAKKIKYCGNLIDKFLQYDAQNSNNNEVDVYTFPELQQLMYEGSDQSVALESSKHLLERNIAPSNEHPNKFYFTRDARLKAGPLLQLSKKDVFESAHRITCPIFLTLFTKSFMFQHKPVIIEVLEIIRKNNMNLEYHELDGPHHLHLNNPERLQGLINAFIAKYDVEDRSL